MVPMVVQVQENSRSSNPKNIIRRRSRMNFIKNNPKCIVVDDATRDARKTWSPLFIFFFFSCCLCCLWACLMLRHVGPGHCCKRWCDHAQERRDIDTAIRVYARNWTGCWFSFRWFGEEMDKFTYLSEIYDPRARRIIIGKLETK